LEKSAPVAGKRNRVYRGYLPTLHASSMKLLCLKFETRLVTEPDGHGKVVILQAQVITVGDFADSLSHKWRMDMISVGDINIYQHAVKIQNTQ
jgi:hypothetical protein